MLLFEGLKTTPAIDERGRETNIYHPHIYIVYVCVKTFVFLFPCSYFRLQQVLALGDNGKGNKPSCLFLLARSLGCLL